MSISYNYFICYTCNEINNDQQGNFYFCNKRKKNIYKCSTCILDNECVETKIKKEVKKKYNIYNLEYLKMKIRNHCCKKFNN